MFLQTDSGERASKTVDTALFDPYIPEKVAEFRCTSDKKHLEIRQTIP